MFLSYGPKVLLSSYEQKQERRIEVNQASPSCPGKYECLLHMVLECQNLPIRNEQRFLSYDPKQRHHHYTNPVIHHA